MEGEDTQVVGGVRESLPVLRTTQWMSKQPPEGRTGPVVRATWYSPEHTFCTQVDLPHNGMNGPPGTPGHIRIHAAFS